MANKEPDLESEETSVAILPSGNTVYLFPREVPYFNKKVRDYKSQYSLSNVSDLAELDRVVMGETMAHRYSTWAAEGKNYWGDDVNDAKMVDLIKSNSTEIRLLKAALGIDKVTRDKTTGDDSVSSRWSEILKKAGEFKVMRNTQFDKALELMAQLDANMTLYNNCSEDERKLMGARQEDIWKWINESVIPEYRKIDADFRENNQKYWISDINR